MHCNGKCYLNKQLKKAGQQETSTSSHPSSLLKFKSIDPYILTIQTWNVQRNLLFTINLLGNNNFLDLSTGHRFPLLQPPDFI